LGRTKGKRVKIIIGAGNTSLDGWISTQENDLNLIDENTWKSKYEINSLSHILAEHVWEHLTYDEGVVAAKICFKYLQYGGLLRVAVPDGNFRNEWYQNMVKIGGPGPKDHPAATHKILYDYKLIKQVFTEAGFVVDLLEYCDEGGAFHYKYWNEEDGRIGRSYRFDTRNNKNEIKMVSIVLDAKKELIL
jgi:predicted SAM-dependent methyltransferase